jgi:putative drug exporter of the RND superfamily
MSVLLYRLGTVIARRRGLVIGTWVLVLVGFLGSSLSLGDAYDDSFTVPGTQSQEGQDLLLDRFDQSGTSAQLLFTAKRGRITEASNAAEVTRLARAVDGVPHVSMVDPLSGSDPVVSDDERSVLGQALFAQKLPSEGTLDEVQKAGTPASDAAVSTWVGGDAYKATSDPSRVPEMLGLLVSFLILCVTFGSLVTAGMPIATALLGVVCTLSAVVLVSRVVTVSSTSPTLAEMLGLAVGIDYALFLLSRYRRQLADDVPPGEAMARALATAGSAVVFAGATVVIALTGLTVAGIPVLTVMGLAAAVAVAVAVLVALTLLPAVALLFGSRLRPRRRDGVVPGRRLLRRRSSRPRVGVPTRWVRLVTRVPLLTVGLVVAGLLVLAMPTSSLELALPDNSTAPEDTPQRQTYDAVTAAFGEGYNAPLTVTAGVITSTDPVGTVDDLARAIGRVDGVVDITQATPNEGGDTALIQVIPEAGQTDPSTAALVNELRDRSPGWEQQYDVDDIMVTGPTAINIDVSDRLAGALLPFAAIVIGLSMLLLMVVFRSVAVPLKATLGYLFSVGAALGAVVVVFQWGWFDGLFTGLAEGPIVSFLPIFVMGVLFGLAMDYEMFLVSAMREEFVRTGEARDAVHRGFRASSVVVTAAALIMTSVFIAFIPGGSSTIKPIAFGLAVGVLVDAFVVRMTLVPAVLVLLGRWAWWLPGWLDRRLPEVDVEGAAMHRRVAFQDLERERGPLTVSARGLAAAPGAEPIDLEAPPGRVTVLEVGSVDPSVVASLLVGRGRHVAGELVVAGLLLPEQASAVQRAAAHVRVAGGVGDPRPAQDRIRERARVSTSSRRRRRDFQVLAEDLTARLERACASPVAPADGRAARAAALDAALAVAGGASVVAVATGDPGDLELEEIALRLSAALVHEGVTSVLLTWADAAPSGASARRPIDVGASEGVS